MRMTVRDVARAAGVSRTTVSNVFSGRVKYSEETRAAVLAAAASLGYRPNLAARSLITHQTGLIGLVLPPDMSPNTLAHNPFYNIIMDSVYAVLRDEAYFDLLIYSTHYQQSQAQISDRIVARNVDGILAIGEFDREFLKDLEASAIPVVLIDNYAPETYPGFSCVNSDDEAGGFLATQHLIEQGYQKIAACVLDMTSPLMGRRVNGYRKAMAAAGLQPAVFFQAGAPFEVGIGFAHLLTAQHFDAAFCTEDMLAVGVLHRLLKDGVAVGQAFGLVGFDNIATGTQVNPELATIDQHIYEKGQTAARILLEVLKKTRSPGIKLTMPVELVVRETSHRKPPPNRKGREKA